MTIFIVIMRIRIKVCCISSVFEAKMAIDHGADALGLVGKMPSGPGPIADDLILSIAKSIIPPTNTFLLTSETDFESVVKHHHVTKTNTIQFVDSVDASTYRKLRNVIPGIRFVQVIHVIDEGSVEEAIEISGHVDFLLLDSGNPKLAVKELGGTGRVHNWKLSRKIRESIKIPLFLAGGIKAENARQAIEEVQPYGLDLCTGVRTNGDLDEMKLGMFFNSIHDLKVM